VNLFDETSLAARESEEHLELERGPINFYLPQHTRRTKAASVENPPARF
jgi:hypothetical protein